MLDFWNVFSCIALALRDIRLCVRMHKIKLTIRFMAGDHILHVDAGVHDLQRVAVPGGRLRSRSWLLLLWLAENVDARYQRTLPLMTASWVSTLLGVGYHRPLYYKKKQTG